MVVLNLSLTVHHTSNVSLHYLVKPGTCELCSWTVLPKW